MSAWAPGSPPSPPGTRSTGSSRPHRPAGAAPHLRGLRDRAGLPGRLGITQSRAFPPAGRTRRPFSRSSARWPTTAPGPSWSKIPPSPSTTRPPAPSGSGGPAPATSPWPRALHGGRLLPSVTSAGNAPVYANYIAEGYFSFVALNYTDTASLNSQITADLHRNHHYHIIHLIPCRIEIPPIPPWAPTSSGNTRPAPSKRATHRSTDPGRSRPPRTPGRGQSATARRPSSRPLSCGSGTGNTAA